MFTLGHYLHGWADLPMTWVFNCSFTYNYNNKFLIVFKFVTAAYKTLSHYLWLDSSKDDLKPLDIFGTETKIKVHRFTNNLQGLQKVMVKDFSWNIIPWNALLFEKTLKQLSILDIENYVFILNTCHDTAKRAETRVGFPVIFSWLQWPIEPKFLQVCYFI